MTGNFHINVAGGQTEPDVHIGGSCEVGESMRAVIATVCGNE